MVLSCLEVKSFITSRVQYSQEDFLGSSMRSRDGKFTQDMLIIFFHTSSQLG